MQLSGVSILWERHWDTSLHPSASDGGCIWGGHKATNRSSLQRTASGANRHCSLIAFQKYEALEKIGLTQEQVGIYWARKELGFPA